MSQTLVCGTTTTKAHYSTIVFGTTAFFETTVVDEATTTGAPVTTTEAEAVATTKGSETTAADATTKASETTAAGSATTEEASATSKAAETSAAAAATTIEASVTTVGVATTVKDTATSAGVETTAKDSATSAGVATTAEAEVTTPAEATDAAETSAAGSATTKSSDGGSASPSGQETTLDFTFAPNPTGSGEITTLPAEESTAPYDECAPPVTTVSTMAPGTLGTLFPGGGSGDGGFDPYTFATETPTPMPGVTRTPACKTTPIVTTTIQFKTCTMIAVSSTTPMVTSTTASMDQTSTTASVDVTTLDSVSSTTDDVTTTADSEESTTPSIASSESVTSEEPSASSDSATSEASVTSEEPSGSSDSVSSESPSATSEASVTSEEPDSSSDSASTESPSATSEASVTSDSVSSESPSATSEASVSSEEPSGSSESLSASSEASVTFDSVSSESPSATSNEPSASSDSVSTSQEDETTLDTIVETTTSSTWSTCNDCSQINVQLFDGNPYEDASSVLNRYSASGCYYVQFFCRPIEIGETSTVSTILSGNTSYIGAPLSANLACRDKKWVLLSSTNALAANVTSLGCVYAQTTTTTKKPTTIPGVDTSKPCMNCSNLVVSQSTYPEGVTYLDHTLETCLSVEAHCVPINGGTEVELMYNNKGVLDSGSTVNRTFTCTKNSKWLDVSTNTIISNISCIMPKVSTTTLVPSTIRDLPSTDAGSPTKDSSSKPVTVRKTTPDAAPPEEETTPSGFTSTEAQITTIEDLPSTGVQVVTEDDIPQTTTTTTLPAVCNNCAALEPLAMTKSGTYNGMLVLWHYKQNGCLRVSISCQATVSDTDVASLYYNPYGLVMSGTGEQAMDLVCNNGNYVYNGEAISTVSCIATTSALVPATTVPPLTTPAPGDDCSGCNRLPVTILSSSSAYTNGLLKATTSYSNCMSVQLTCYGTTSTDQVSLIYADAQLATGTGSAALELTCSSGGMWMTSGLQSIESISCGYIPLGITTTTAPTSCGVCANMESAEALLQSNAYDGMIVLYNYVDSTTQCKRVDISCQGTTSTENATLIFDPLGPVLTGTEVHEISLNCSSDGKWKYSGTVIDSVSCVVSTASTVTVPATTDLISTSTTTLNPTIPLCAQCTRPTVNAVSSIDNSLTNGLTSMTVYTVNSCSVVQVTCSGSTSTERVTLLAATTSLVSGVGSVSFNLTCNSAAGWMTAAGTLVDSVACGRYNLTSSTGPTTTTMPTTTTTAASQCSTCANMMAKAVNPTDGSYDGMIVLNHYTDATGCRHVDVSCGPTLTTENATVIFGATVVATGAATHSFSLTCNSNANWVYQSTSVSTVSCVISTATNGVTVAPTTTTQAVIDDTASACSQCGKAPIVSVGNGSTYLNGFSTVVQSTNAAGCSLLYIKCQGSTTADAVALLSAGLPLQSGFGSTSANLTCNTQSQWATSTGSVITSLACGHKNAATTVSSITTLAPTGQCASCANMVAESMASSSSSSSSSEYDGMVVMDHFIDPSTNCRTVAVTCAPTTSTENATLFFDSSAVATGMSSHTLDLTCDASAQWTYSGSVVSAVGCLISTGTGAAATTVTTLAPVTNPANNLCSQCTRLPVVSASTISSNPNGFTTLVNTINSFGCSTVSMVCQGLTSADTVAIVINGAIYADMGTNSVNYTDFSCNSQGVWTSTSVGNITSVVCERITTSAVASTTPTTTTTVSSLCNSCPDVRPLSMASGSSYYDGMIVINHYKDRTTACRKASIDCMPTMDYEVAELMLNQQAINTGSAVGVNMECSSAGTWTYDEQTFSTTSCLVANSSSSLPASGKKRKKRQAGTGLTACQSCSTLPLTSLYSFYPYMNGFSTISMDDSSTCMTATAVCEGTTTSDAVAWIASGTILASGINMINLTFTCNSLSSWQTSSGSVFSSLSCGRQIATTTVATTTVASEALNCPNLVADPLTTSDLASDESNGQLILDHFVNTTIMAREVTIICYGSSANDNTTISFDGGTRTYTGTGQIELTLVCSSTGQWMRNGIAVETAACIVVAPSGTTIALTTIIPTTPTTSAGSLPSTNCPRNVMLTIPSGYNAGYLSMNTISTETSLEVQMSCAAPTGISESLLLSSTGAISTSGSATTNMTLTCNSASQWVVSSASGTGIAVGTVVSSLACVVAASTTTLATATVAAACQQCANLPAIGLLASQLEANERNGQFVLDHVSATNACRVVYLSCAGSSASENSTILFNGGSQTMSTQGITSTSLTCTSSATWDWYGSSIGYASCKVADRALTATTTAPLSLTTTAYVVPGDTGLACSRSSLVNPLITGDAGAYLVLDTTIVNGGLSTTLSCAAPDDSGSAVLTNGDGSVLGQSSNGLVNMTLTCNSNSQWVLTAISASTTGTSAALGTIVSALKCGEIASATTTTTVATATTASGACGGCVNMQAIALTSTQLVSGATNGQLLLSHSVDATSNCRIVVIKCRGDNTNQNATIFFNANGQTLSAMYGQVSTSMACSSSNTWQRNGVEIDGVACMITSVVGATSTAPSPITTLAPSSTTLSASGPSASCNTAFITAVSTSGYSSGFMTVDTTVSGSSMTANVNCASPVSTGTAALLDSSNNVVSTATGSTNLTLTCNANSQWVTSSGTIITSLSCGTVAAATTTLAAAATTTSAAASGDCSTATWNAWQEWSDCTDTCGSCGTQQRFRTCTKPLDTCTCTGSAYDKAYCNLAVCKFPRTSCCDGFTPRSSGGTFVCMSQCISLGCLGGFGGCGSSCLLGLCLQAPIIQPLGCPCGVGFMCMRGGCVARAAAGTKTFREDSASRPPDLKDVSLMTPDEHFATCCTILDVPSSCSTLCSYSSYSSEEVSAVLSLQSACPVSAIRNVHYCAARATNHTECCSKSLVPPHCHSFCDQSQGKEENEMSLGQLQCVHYFNDIKTCFVEYANSEYFEGYNEDSDVRELKSEDTSLISSF
ncbi:unnamed protein product [Caenorhabditis sp. 36 PRJEB53466]|nr:unnamed protein product [Caenorhabditis sp. 36 PRJEB53466]